MKSCSYVCRIYIPVHSDLNSSSTCIGAEIVLLLSFVPPCRKLTLPYEWATRVKIYIRLSRLTNHHWSRGLLTDCASNSQSTFGGYLRNVPRSATTRTDLHYNGSNRHRNAPNRRSRMSR